MISTRNGRRGRRRARTRTRSTRRAVCRALPSTQPAWALGGGLRGRGAYIGGVGGGVSVAPRRTFYGSAAFGHVGGQRPRGAGKRAPEGRNTSFRAGGVAFLALLWHLNAKSTPRGACAWVFFISAPVSSESETVLESSSCVASMEPPIALTPMKAPLDDKYLVGHNRPRNLSQISNTKQQSDSLAKSAT